MMDFCTYSFSPCVGLGLILYGWTVAYKVHWIVPIIGTFAIGLGAFFVLVRSDYCHVTEDKD